MGMPGHVGVTTTILPSRGGSTQPCSALCSALPCGPSLPVGPAVPLLCGLAGKEAPAAVPGSAFLLQ